MSLSLSTAGYIDAYLVQVEGDFGELYDDVGISGEWGLTWIFFPHYNLEFGTIIKLRTEDIYINVNLCLCKFVLFNFQYEG